MRILGAVLLVGTLARASAAEVVESYCALSGTGPDGRRAELAPGLSILEYNDKLQFRGLSADNAKIDAILCKRSSIVPQPHDYQVTLAGYALMLFDGERTAILDRSEGKYTLRLLEGKLSRRESRAVSKQLRNYPSDYPKDGT